MNIELNPWILEKTVLPQHTDHAGVMWHGSYMNWLEEARVDALSKLGISYSELALSGYEMPVVDMKIKFSRPLFHGDNVVLKSSFVSKKGPRLICETKFVKDFQKPSAEAIVHLVLVKRIGSIFRIVRNIPEELFKAFDLLQKGPQP